MMYSTMENYVSGYTQIKPEEIVPTALLFLARILLYFCKL